MATLPTGTVTFLFTDIEGSTRLLELLGAGYQPLLERHHALLREAIASGQGTEISTEGDAFFAVFASAPQRGSRGHGGTARAGGRAVAGRTPRCGCGWVSTPARACSAATATSGLDVHRAARVAAAGHGGQVLLSGVHPGARDRAASRRGWPLATWVSIGSRTSRDRSTSGSWSIEGLPIGLPATATPSTPPPTTSRLQLTSFLGRAARGRTCVTAPRRRESAADPDRAGRDGQDATRRSRWPRRPATDSRTACTSSPWSRSRAADLLLPDHRPGRWAWSIPEPPRSSAWPSTSATSSFLLVLDNFEQVDAAAPLVGELLSARPAPDGPRHQPEPAPRLRRAGVPGPAARPARSAAPSRPRAVLRSSSRWPCSWSGRWRSGPTSRWTTHNAPGRGRDLRPARRAAAGHRAGGRPGPGAEPAGHPGPAQRPAWASSPAAPATCPTRQQTLRGAIAWSHDLLDEADKAAFARLSVFSGGSPASR